MCLCLVNRLHCCVQVQGHGKVQNFVWCLSVLFFLYHWSLNLQPNWECWCTVTNEKFKCKKRGAYVMIITVIICTDSNTVTYSIWTHSRGYLAAQGNRSCCFCYRCNLTFEQLPCCFCCRSNITFEQLPCCFCYRCSIMFEQLLCYFCYRCNTSFVQLSSFCLKSYLVVFVTGVT